MKKLLVILVVLNVGFIVFYTCIRFKYNDLNTKLEKVLEELREDVLKMENVVGNYSLLGINEFSSSSIKYLVSIECKANCQYQIKRDYFKLVRNVFNKNKIEIPYNKLDVNVRGKNE